MSRVCAFLAMENPEGFFVYDLLAFDPVRQFGWEVVDVPWSQPQRPWSDFDAVVIRSPWDYQNEPQRFLSTWVVIELELIEPSLSFSYDTDSPQGFAEAFDELMFCRPDEAESEPLPGNRR